MYVCLLFVCMFVYLSQQVCMYRSYCLDVCLPAFFVCMYCMYVCMYAHM